MVVIYPTSVSMPLFKVTEGFPPLITACFNSWLPEVNTEQLLYLRQFLQPN